MVLVINSHIATNVSLLDGVTEKLSQIIGIERNQNSLSMNSCFRLIRFMKVERLSQLERVGFYLRCLRKFRVSYHRLGRITVTGCGEDRYERYC